MANRQARREQRRASRRRSTAGGPAGRPGPQGGGGGAPGWLTQPFTLVVIGVIVIAAVVLGAVIGFGGGGADEELVEALEDHQIPSDMADGTTLGSDDAPIQMVMYEDFQCPFCLEYTALEEPAIIEEYVEPGLVQIEFRHLPILGPESTQAALAAECAADQGMFWEYQNALFLRQAEAGQGSNEELNVGRFSNDGLKELADDIGLDRSIFDDCLESGQHLDEVQADQAEAQQLGITGTPGFTLNGQPIPGGQVPGTIEGWRIVFDGILEDLGEGEGTPGAEEEVDEGNDGEEEPEGEGEEPEPTAAGDE